jgi:hypothetical protein
MTSAPALIRSAPLFPAPHRLALHRAAGAPRRGTAGVQPVEPGAAVSGRGAGTQATPHFAAVRAFTEEALARGGAVCFHCAAGISRSTTMVLSFLMGSKRLSLREAFALVYARRRVAWPNRTFMRQLVAYELELQEQGWLDGDAPSIRRPPLPVLAREMISQDQTLCEAMLFIKEASPPLPASWSLLVFSFCHRAPHLRSLTPHGAPNLWGGSALPRGVARRTRRRQPCRTLHCRLSPPPPSLIISKVMLK